jgi:hypothetical protein
VVGVNDRLGTPKSAFGFTSLGGKYPALAPLNNAKHLFPGHAEAVNEEGP